MVDVDLLDFVSDPVRAAVEFIDRHRDPSVPLETGAVGGRVEGDDHRHDAIESAQPKQQTGGQREQKRKTKQVQFSSSVPS